MVLVPRSNRVAIWAQDGFLSTASDEAAARPHSARPRKMPIGSSNMFELPTCPPTTRSGSVPMRRSEGTWAGRQGSPAVQPVAPVATSQQHTLSRGHTTPPLAEPPTQSLRAHAPLWWKPDVQQDDAIESFDLRHALYRTRANLATTALREDPTNLQKDAASGLAIWELGHNRFFIREKLEGIKTLESKKTGGRAPSGGAV